MVLIPSGYPQKEGKEIRVINARLALDAIRGAGIIPAEYGDIEGLIYLRKSVEDHLQLQRTEAA